MPTSMLKEKELQQGVVKKCVNQEAKGHPLQRILETLQRLLRSLRRKVCSSHRDITKYMHDQRLHEASCGNPECKCLDCKCDPCNCTEKDPCGCDDKRLIELRGGQ